MKKTLLLLCAGACLAACASTGGTPDCNIYVIALMKEKHIYLPQANADGLDNYLKASPDWIKVPRKNGKLDHVTAYNAAKNGRATLVTYNTQSARSGHIAEVYGKNKMAWSESFNALVPYTKGKVNGGSPGVFLLSRQFRPGHEKQMNYYIYKK